MYDFLTRCDPFLRGNGHGTLRLLPFGRELFPAKPSDARVAVAQEGLRYSSDRLALLAALQEVDVGSVCKATAGVDAGASDRHQRDV